MTPWMSPRVTTKTSELGVIMSISDDCIVAQNCAVDFWFVLAQHADTRQTGGRLDGFDTDACLIPMVIGDFDL